MVQGNKRYLKSIFVVGLLTACLSACGGGGSASDGGNGTDEGVNPPTPPTPPAVQLVDGQFYDVDGFTNNYPGGLGLDAANGGCDGSKRYFESDRIRVYFDRDPNQGNDYDAQLIATRAEKSLKVVLPGLGLTWDQFKAERSQYRADTLSDIGYFGYTEYTDKVDETSMAGHVQAIWDFLGKQPPLTMSEFRDKMVFNHQRLYDDRTDKGYSVNGWYEEADKQWVMSGTQGRYMVGRYLRQLSAEEIESYVRYLAATPQLGDIEAYGTTSRKLKEHASRINRDFLYVCMSTTPIAHGGFAASALEAISVPAPSLRSHYDEERVVTHEMTHHIVSNLMQDNLSANKPYPHHGYENTAMYAIPRWFSEGQANFVAGMRKADRDEYLDFHETLNPVDIKMWDDEQSLPRSKQGDFAYGHYALAYSYLNAYSGKQAIIDTLKGIQERNFDKVENLEPCYDYTYDRWFDDYEGEWLDDRYPLSDAQKDAPLRRYFFPNATVEMCKDRPKFDIRFKISAEKHLKMKNEAGEIVPLDLNDFIENYRDHMKRFAEDDSV